MDSLERQIRRIVLLELIGELYDRNLSDAIAVKEWLQSKLGALVEDDARTEDAERAQRYTNHYLCPKDNTRWDACWSCLCNDRCPTCESVVEPYATTRNADQCTTIHNQETYDRANGVER